MIAHCQVGFREWLTHIFVWQGVLCVRLCEVSVRPPTSMKCISSKYIVKSCIIEIHGVVFVFLQKYPSVFLRWISHLPPAHIRSNPANIGPHLQPTLLWSTQKTAAVHPGIPSLVGGWKNPLKNMTSSIGMIRNSQYEWDNKIDVPNHKPVPVFPYKRKTACSKVCWFTDLIMENLAVLQQSSSMLKLLTLNKSGIKDTLLRALQILLLLLP